MLGKTVLVTGSGKGIGAAIAEKFAEHGANIVLNVRGADHSKLVSKIEQLGVKCAIVKADVSDFYQAKYLVDTAKDTFGTLDVLVNNAGITRDNLLIRMSESDFDSVIDTNLKGTWNTTRHAANIMMKQRGGAIINITSVVGVTGNAGQVNYAASKAGMIGLTKSAARELAPRGVTCNAIAPGFIESDMTDSLSDEVKSKYLESIPLKRFGDAVDVARAALFLAENGYITGEVINVNGGMHM
ncbi:MAG: 3-oxoacyl-[acyl-carrier-protein] reductase [Defluviitaleaceae bacterium]|nr:3-oxoacyl-[acyl-carrier-protein] reductase [Defluviitaleaceae bacterium]